MVILAGQFSIEILKHLILYFFVKKYKSQTILVNPTGMLKADITKEEDIDPKLWGVMRFSHLAGSTHERNPKYYHVNNFEATKRLIDKSETNGVKRFIYISTQAIGEKGVLIVLKRTGGKLSHAIKTCVDNNSTGRYLRHWK